MCFKILQAIYPTDGRYGKEKLDNAPKAQTVERAALRTYP
jgi:hypothetical protein